MSGQAPSPYERTQATTYAHDTIRAAVRVIERRRPYTAELDATVTLLTGMRERHHVSVDSEWNPKCSCGAPLEDLDGLCPDMGAVQYLVDAVIEDDQRELVDFGVTHAAYAPKGGCA